MIPPTTTRLSDPRRCLRDAFLSLWICPKYLQRVPKVECLFVHAKKRDLSELLLCLSLVLYKHINLLPLFQLFQLFHFVITQRLYFCQSNKTLGGTKHLYPFASTATEERGAR